MFILRGIMMPIAPSTARAAPVSAPAYSRFITTQPSQDHTAAAPDIADHLGLTIETISRMITALRNEGAILIPNSQQIVLRDMAALSSLAAED